MKRAIVITLLAIAAAAGPAAAQDPAPLGATAEIDRVVALVDGAPIWRSAVDEMIAPMLDADPKAFRGELEPKVVDHLIDDALIRGRAHALHVEVAEPELADATQQIKTQNNLDDAGLEAALKSQGYTMASYRLALRQQILELKTFRLWAASHPPAEPSVAEIDQAIAAMGTDPKAVDRDKVRELVRNEKVGALRGAWIAELRRTARIEHR